MRKLLTDLHYITTLSSQSLQAEQLDAIQPHIEQALKLPRIVCLCGSTRFKDAFLAAARKKTLAGEIVLTVGMFGHKEGIDMDGPMKKMLDELHLRKIDLADYVHVLNVGKYIGESTAREIEHARAHGKHVTYLE